MGTLRFATGHLTPAPALACTQALIESGMPVPGPEYRFPPALAEYFARVSG